MYTSIPSLHVSSKSKAKGNGVVKIISRTDATHSGQFEVRLDVRFDSLVDDYPGGSLTIISNLNDSANGNFVATSIELINSYGSVNPTIYLTGRCMHQAPAGTTTAGAAAAKGCKYWLMLANNKKESAVTGQGTPDVAGFVIIDRNGDRISYGTGALISGDFDVSI